MEPLIMKIKGADVILIGRRKEKRFWWHIETNINYQKTEKNKTTHWITIRLIFIQMGCLIECLNMEYQILWDT